MVQNIWEIAICEFSKPFPDEFMQCIGQMMEKFSWIFESGGFCDKQIGFMTGQAGQWS